MEITNMVVACKMSDGTVRTIITNRETEVEILRTIRSSSNGDIFVSEMPIIGMDIILPAGERSLDDYISYAH